MTATRLAIGVAGLGVLARCVLYLTSPPPQPWEYEVIADNLLGGRGFGVVHLGTWYRTYGSPPFAYLCAGLYALFGHHPALVLGAQWIFSAATALGCYVLGWRLFSARVGVAAAALVSFHPGLAYYDSRNLHPLSFDAALLTASLVAIVTTWKCPSVTRGFAVGFLHGLTVFERNSAIGWPVAFVAWTARGRPGARARTIVAFAVGFAVVLAPWLIRSVAIYGYPVVASTTWEILWRGNNPAASGGSYARDGVGVAMPNAAPAGLQAELRGGDEIEQQRIFAREAKRFVREQPGEAVRLFLRKLGGFWWFMPQSGLLYPRLYLRLYAAYFAVVAALAVVGIAAGLTDAAARGMTLTIIGLVVSVSLVHALFYVEIRHRWGVEPILLVFTAAGGATLMAAAWGDRFRRWRPAGPRR